jgi:hypothetical protein
MSARHGCRASLNYVKGAEIPIQIIESKRLDESENLWLRSLSDSLDTEGMEKVLNEQEKHADAKLNAYMHALMIANPNAKTRMSYNAVREYTDVRAALDE